MNKFCLEFMQRAVDQMETSGEDVAKFKESLKDCHAHGYYLAYSSKKERWSLSNKMPELLEHQKENFDKLMDITFTKVGAEK